MPLHKNTARQLIAELRQARQELAVLRGIADTVQAFQIALGAEPPRRGASPDVLWQAESELAHDDESSPAPGDIA